MSTTQAAKNRAAEWTVSHASKVMEIDKGDFADLCAQAGIKPRIAGPAHYYPRDDTTQIVMRHKLSRDKSSTDLRNEAQAEKAQVETEILRGKYIPIAEVVAPVTAYLSAVNKEIQNCEMPNEAKENLIAKLKSVREQLGIDDDA